MSTEAKVICRVIGLLCAMMFVIGTILGCKQSGIQGHIYHEGILIAKTNCDMDLRFELNQESVIVESLTHEYGNKIVRERYQYANDGKYRVERKECEH